MSGGFLKNLDRTNLFVGLSVWLIALAVYVKTLSPTVSFWDCGEFIAVSAILGIPHPPGSPLYVVFGRLFSIIPFFADISARVNLLSAVSSAFTAVFCYLIGVRILRFWLSENENILNRFLIHGGSASGALVAAFGITNWNNSVEAEVYGLSMALFTLIFWLTLLFLEKREESSGQKLMLLVFYIAFLGISVHMNTFLVMPIVVLAFIMKKETPQYVWFALAAFVGFELFLIFALSSQPDEIPYFVPVLIVLVVYLFFIFSFEKINTLYVIAAAGFALAAAPLYPIMYESAMLSSGRDASISESTVSSFYNLGKISFVALIAFAIICLFRYLGRRKANTPSAYYLHIAIFILTAALMTAVLMIDAIKGYNAFLILSVVLTGILAVVIYKYIDWAILLAVLGPLLIVLGVKEYFYGSVLSLAALVILGLFFRLKGWRTAVLIVVMAAMGFTSHIFIPIRSAQKPEINENNPSSSLQATINFIERKQYGSESMVSRMFNRRAEWTNQFGDFNRMGFWGFFKSQYGVNGSAFVFPFLIGIFGIWEIVRKRTTRGVLLLLLVMISSVGLILYMNFADGTKINPLTGGDYLEVRERDYFFTPAYVLFGLCIGLGISTIVYYVNDTVKNASPILKKTTLGVASLLFLFPIVTLAKNYNYADRTGNYLAYDYGWDLLQSAEKDAILFTNGDNDTFPLWCLQQAYGIRKDVRVVNLSLSNTHWYIKQLEPNLGLKFSLTDEQIDKLRPFRTSDGSIIRTHHQVADQLINENFGLVPISFSVTVGADNRRFHGKSIDSLLALMGFAWRLHPERKDFGVLLEESYEFFMDPEKFRCRGANDPDVYLDETSERLSHNLANGFMVLADTLRRAKDYQRAENLLMRARELIPRAETPVQLLARIYSEQEKTEKLQALVDTVTYGDKEVILTALAQVYRRNGDFTQAEATYNKALAINPTYRPAFDDLMRLYMSNNKFNAMRAGILRWLQYNPQDKDVRQIYEQMEQLIEGSDTDLGGEQ